MALKERKVYPIFKTFVKGGRLYFLDRNGFDRYLSSLEGKRLDLILKTHHKSRSRQEEKYYHAVVVRMVADELGITDQEAHDLLRGLFLRIEERRTTKDGRQVCFVRILSTTELSDVAFREYWNKCLNWAALPTKDEGLGPDSGLGIYIPLPNEVDYADW